MSPLPWTRVHPLALALPWLLVLAAAAPLPATVLEPLPAAGLAELAAAGLDAGAPPATPPPAGPPAAPAGAPLVSPLPEGELADLPPLDPRVPRPQATLGHAIGESFTHWDTIGAYLETLAAASDRVKVWDYGRTYEGRPLKLVAITSPENLARLDTLRQERLRLADGDAAGLSRSDRNALAAKLPVVVWLAYGIHGNESSSAEAAMATAYVLAAGGGDVPELLRHTIVLIDPLSNPDGRERYVSSYEERRGADPNPRPAAAEHGEAWPGGRQNHYLLDLNRDWAWASQQETRARIAAYRSWEPQVYVDFHEMGTESSYFFPPPADPVNPLIDRRIVSWLDIFGRANASTFDRHGWLYFKGESYDLFYPAYGDTYPSLRGAVGMTYEMAGGGHGGLTISLPDGSVLTLADRVARHLETSLATVRTTAANAAKLMADFADHRAAGGPDHPHTYLWNADHPEARALADLLVLHGIRVGQLGQDATLKVHKLARGGGPDEDRAFAGGTYAVSTAQPLGDLVAALLETESTMPQAFLDRQRQRLDQNLDTEFYDITAWSLPLAFNFDAWVADGPGPGLRPLAPAAGGVHGPAILGVLVRPQGLAGYQLAAALQKRGVRFRLALTGFSAATGNVRAAYPAGTLFIPRRGNPADLDATLSPLLAELGVSGQGVSSSFDLSGLSLGSSDMAAVRKARTGLVGGEGVDPTSFGFLWFLLDRQIGVDHDRLDLARLRDVDLGDYDAIVLPDGDYEDRISAKQREALDAWVKSGGILVAIGDAIPWLQQHEMTTFKKWEPPKPGDDPESSGDDSVSAEPGEATLSTATTSLADRPIFTPGAAIGTRMPAQNPLTVGLDASPAVLVEGTLILRATGDPQKDILVARDEHPVLAGFAFPEAEERLAGALLVGRESRGRGSVILFAQDPAYRLFWRGTMPILLNALLYGPSVGLGGR